MKGKAPGKCYQYCCLSYGHSGDCICKISKEIEHLCDKECKFFNKAKNCTQYCNKTYGHSGDHLCSSFKHVCPNNCYYFGKCKGKCEQFCKLQYGHENKCICKVINNNNYHLCIKNCDYYEKSRGCNKDCIRTYEHEGLCKCNVNDEFHFCIKKCELCENTECGHVYNHEKKDLNIKCCKCKDQICSLTGQNHHICGGQHNCKEKCQAKGYCQIISYVQVEEKVYQSINGEDIKYNAKKSQELKKNNCNIKIKENESNHPNGHICEVKAHKCGYQCPQCEYYCTEDEGHTGLHNCFHGNIKNSYISVSDNGKIAKVKKENKDYNFQEGEKAIIFFCDEYCKEQGQGHIHQFISNFKKIEQDENVKLIDSKKHIYECKCSYFWENILKFKSNFTTEEQKKFSLCNWKCKYTGHQTSEYCQLSLWHEKTKIIPNGVYGKWIYEGHVFKCSHPIAIYSIFLVDQSESMKSISQNPTNQKIKEKLNNMLGASIQAIDSFCKLRNEKSVKDKCSLIGFNISAKLIVKDIYMEENETITNICLSNLKPEGGTIFYKAFQESYLILKEIDRNEYIPIIILLTDGIDHGYKKTKPFVEKVRNIFLILLFKII